jgi:transglutaminase-like putative cysteine protease
MTLAGEPGFIKTTDIDWRTVECATYEVQQWLRYEYPGPIDDVRQMLMLVPRDSDGGQRLLDFELQITPPARPRFDVDRFGNRVCHIAIPRVEGPLEFGVQLRVERRTGVDIPMLAPDEASTYLLPTPLTEPTDALRAAAEPFARDVLSPAERAERINSWVHEHIEYTADVTGVRTTADDALRVKQGVCQDYAHLMLALCRLAGLPARYVSGHLLGEGAMHAWVQVLLPAASHAGALLAWQPFDPTHGRHAGMTYITVAFGRDYGDVSPTRGSYRAPYTGWLAGGHKRAGVVALDCA